MACLYTEQNFSSAVENFTNVFKERLLEISKSDVDLLVRCRALALLSTVIERDLLESGEERTLLASLSSYDAKVRTAASEPVNKLIELQAGELEEADSDVALLKALIRLLASDHEDKTELSLTASPRTQQAMEALIAVNPRFGQWKAVLRLLLAESHAKDGSEDSEERTPGFTRPEEALLLDLLATSMSQTVQAAIAEGSETFDESLELGPVIRACTTLLAKNRTDGPLVARTLALIPILPVVALQQTHLANDREELHEELTSLFERHQEAAILKLAVKAKAVLARSEGANADIESLGTLLEQALQSLRESCEDREMEIAALSEDAVHRLAVTLERVLTLLGHSDLHETLFAQSAESSTPWQMVYGIAARGRLGYDEESQVSAENGKAGESALTLTCTLHRWWPMRSACWANACFGQRKARATFLATFCPRKR